MAKTTVSVEADDGWKISKDITYTDPDDLTRQLKDFQNSPIRHAFMREATKMWQDNDVPVKE